VEFDLWLEAGVGTEDRRLVVTFADNDTSEAAKIYFGRNEPGQVSNKTDGILEHVAGYSYEAETWMHVKMIIDQTADTLDLMIDGELLLDDASTQDGAISSERMVFETRDGNERILIDNLLAEVHTTAPLYCGNGGHAWLNGDIIGHLGNPRTAMWIYTI